MTKPSLALLLLLWACNPVTSHGFMTSSADIQRAARQSQHLTTAKAAPTATSLVPNQLVHISVNAGGDMQSVTELLFMDADEREEDASNPKQLLDFLDASALSSPTLALHELLDRMAQGLKSAKSKTEQFLSLVAQMSNARLVGIASGILVIVLFLAFAYFRCSEEKGESPVPEAKVVSAVVPSEVCGAPNVHSIRAHLDWYLLAIACLALCDLLLNILMGVKLWGVWGIEWGWACVAALLFMTIDVVMKNCFFLPLRRCLLHRSGFTPSEVQEIDGPRWHLDDHWLENLIADPLRKHWTQVIDAACRKGGHLWVGLSNYVVLVPLVIGADRATEAAIGGSFIVFVTLSLRCAAIWRFRGEKDLWRWRHLTFLFGAGDRIRDGRLGHLNILISSMASSWGRLACLAIVHLGLPSEKKNKDLWHLSIMLVSLPVVVGDALGELIGTPFGLHTFQVRGLGEINMKSIEGCIAVLVGSLVPCLLVVSFNKDLQLQASTKIGLPCVLALLTTATETLSFRGTDNFFIPVVNSAAVVAWWAILES